MTISPSSRLDFDLHRECDTSGTCAAGCDSRGLIARLREELVELEPVVSAATLATVAFRMRDEAGLVTTLRALTEAIEELERRRRPE